MRNFLEKNGVIVAFVLGFILDAQYGLLEKLITDLFWLNIAKGIGAVALAYFTKDKLGIVAKKGGAVIPSKGF